MNSKTIAVAAASLALSLMAPSDAYSDDRKGSKGSKTYRVTITNLTAGQPLTPPILAIHKSSTGIFEVGQWASEDIQQIAENGNGAPLLQSLSEDTGVHEVVAGSAPLVPANNPGGTPFGYSETFYVTAQGSAKYLSFVSMLICTNDGFTGLNAISLPKDKTTVYTSAYDARTEMNTEDLADIVPPCQGLIGVSSDDTGTGMSNPLLAEAGVVIPHAGINGGDDLIPHVHNWADPVTKIEIERVKRKD